MSLPLFDNVISSLKEIRKKSEPEPTELTALARRFLPPKEAFAQVDITDVSEQPGQLELICHKLCKEIDRLTAENKAKDEKARLFHLEVQEAILEVQEAIEALIGCEDDKSLKGE